MYYITPYILNKTQQIVVRFWFVDPKWICTIFIKTTLKTILMAYVEYKFIKLDIWQVLMNSMLVDCSIHILHRLWWTYFCNQPSNFSHNRKHLQNLIISLRMMFDIRIVSTVIFFAFHVIIDHQFIIQYIFMDKTTCYYIHEAVCSWLGWI